MRTNSISENLTLSNCFRYSQAESQYLFDFLISDCFTPDEGESWNPALFCYQKKLFIATELLNFSCYYNLVLFLYIMGFFFHLLIQNYPVVRYFKVLSMNISAVFRRLYFCFCRHNSIHGPRSHWQGHKGLWAPCKSHLEKYYALFLNFEKPTWILHKSFLSLLIQTRLSRSFANKY